MLEKYFSAPKTLRRLRTGLSGSYIDGFADTLESACYSKASAVRYLRNAAHLGQFTKLRGGDLAVIAASALKACRRHLPSCRCSSSNGGKTDHHTCFGVKLFYNYLVQRGVCQRHSVSHATETTPELVVCFRDWFQKHRGAAKSTLRLYCRGAVELLEALGPDTHQWDTRRVRKFVLYRSTRCGMETAPNLIPAPPAFFRHLTFHVKCPATST